MTGLYDHLFRSVGPSALNFVSGYQAYLRQLRQTQFLPREELRRRQEERLKLLCEYAFRHVPLFKKLGGTPDFGDPVELPILSKSVLRRHLHLAISEREARMHRRHGLTSGTSGAPLEFWTDRRSDGLRLAARYLFDEWIGLPFGSRIARIVARPNRFSRLLANELRIPLDSVNSKTAAGVLERIFRFQPEGIIGQPYSLRLLAEAKTNIRPNFSKTLHCIVATAETLLESERAAIEETFECSLYNRYGLREISGYVAQECRAQEGLHVNVGHVMVEIVDNGRAGADGKPGRIIVTDLHNRVMPFIRYDTEDVGVLLNEPCSCGVTWPLLKIIQGRQSDYVIIKDGARVPLSIFVDSFLHSFAGRIAQVQFVQRREGFTIVRIVPEKRFTSDDMVKVRDYFSRLLSRFDLELVHDLPVAKSGKRPLLIRETSDQTTL